MSTSIVNDQMLHNGIFFYIGEDKQVYIRRNGVSMELVGPLIFTGDQTLTGALAVSGLAEFDGNVLPAPVGAGMAGTGTVVDSSVIKVGDLFVTRIYVDVTGLTSADSDLDVIGIEDTALPCHIGQITAAVNGTIVGGTMQVLEDFDGVTDVGIYSADDGTLVYEDLITDEDDEVAIVAPIVQATTGGAIPIAGVPAADQYLYLVNGANDTPEIFATGKFLLTLYGI